MRSNDKVIALLSHTRGRGVNPKPFEAGAGMPSPQHKSPWALTGARPGKRANTRQTTGSGDDADKEDPSYDGNEQQGLPQRTRRTTSKPDAGHAKMESFPQQQQDGNRYPNGRGSGQVPSALNTAVPEAGMAIEIGEADQLNGDVVPYSGPSTEMALNVAMEQQVSSEISALMQAALQSGRQVDVELPSGAVMRIR